MPDSEIYFGVRWLRGRAEWPEVGIFAQRGKNRPNRIGVTVCRLLSVNDLTIEVKGLDAGIFAYLGVIEGDYLNQRVNSERTNFTFPASRDGDEMFDDVTLDGIRTPALACVTDDLQPFLQEINNEKLAPITNYITSEGPQYPSLVTWMILSTAFRPCQRSCA